MFYREDCKKAGMPKLPVVENKERVLKAIGKFTALYIIATFTIFLTLSQSTFNLAIVALLNYTLVELLVKLSSVKYRYRKLFRLTNPHLGVVFILYLIFL